ncbi:MAG TPA: CBS domain-containing protein [Candidatus Limnocylindria bacterium]|nr:CBS domain-containing protein [Candidatus Limnocylindria bacterium]
MTTAVELRVGNLMTLDPITISPDEPAHEAERILKTYRVSGLPVVDGGVVIGVLSQTDLLTARSSELISGNWARLRVRHLMTHPAMTVDATATVTGAARQMIDHHIHRLVVVDDAGGAIGVVTPLDLLRALLDEADVA